MSTPAPRFDIRSHVSLSASAGSGKTRSLTLRLLRILLSGAPVDTILCTTFTNKATHEMSERLMRMLACLEAGGPVGSQTKEEFHGILADVRGIERPGPGDVSGAIRDAAHLKGELLRRYSRLRISTMDSFFNSVLRLFPFEAGVAPDFDILGEEEEKTVFREALDRLLSEIEESETEKKILQGLIFCLSQTETNPESLLAGYFEDCASRRIQIRLYEKAASASPPGPDDVLRLHTESTAAAAACLSAAQGFAGLALGHAGDLSSRGTDALRKCLDADSPGELLGMTLIKKSSYLEYSFLRKLPDRGDLHMAFDAIHGALHRYLITNDRFAVQALLFFFDRYIGHADATKKRIRRLSFADVERLCFELLVGYGSDGPLSGKDGTDYFYFRLDSRLKHLLMDEFQDTNTTQWEIFQPIVTEITADREGSFFYVGDPKQAIYRFRGGESRLFHHVHRSLSGRDILPDVLPENYRSSPVLVDFFNRIFLHVARSYDYDFSAQKAALTKSGCVELVVAPSPEDEDPADASLLAAANRVTALRDAGVPLREIAVLMRDNKTCARMGSILHERAIAARTENADSLFDCTSVMTVVSLIRYLAHPRDEFHLVGFLSRVRPETLPALLEAEPGRRLKALHALDPKAHETITRLLDLADLAPVRIVLTMAIRGFALGRVFSDTANLGRLIEVADESSFERPGLMGFLDFADGPGRSVATAPDAAPDAVQVLTVHKAKGLEFDAVILPQLDDKITFNKNKSSFMMPFDKDFRLESIHLTPSKDELPFAGPLVGIYEAENAGARLDALNLLYVALTRARRGLYLIAPPAKPEKEKKSAKPDDEPPALTWQAIILDALRDSVGPPDEEGRIYSDGKWPDVVVSPAGPAKSEASAAASSEPEVETHELPAHAHEPDSASTATDDEDEDTGSITIERAAARIYGDAVHAGMEVIARSLPVERAYGEAISRFGSMLGEPDRARLRRDLEAAASDGALRALLTSGRVLTELPLLETGKGLRRADAVIFSDDCLTVLDYKTHESERDEDRYAKQVQDYMRLLGATCLVNKTEGMLVFIESGRVMKKRVEGC